MNAEYANQPTTTITLKMPVGLFEQVKGTAVLEECDPSAIINCFVMEGLTSSRAAIKRMQFAEHAKEVLEKHGVHQQAIDEIYRKLLF